MKICRLAVTIFLALSAPSALGTQSAEAKTLNVLVWDQYFDPADPAWPEEPGLAKLGDIFAWDPDYANPGSGRHKPSMHGLEVAYIMAKDFPEVIVHRAHDAFLPWQDPLVCVLAKDKAFEQELTKHGYAQPANCEANAAKRIAEFKTFMEQNHILLVNMSHGTFYENYVLHNPILLHQKYPLADYAIVQRYVYLNFTAMSDVIETIFRDNPNVLFVVAAGNNSEQLDHEVIRQWHEPGDQDRPGPPVVRVPTYFGSFAARYDNVIAVASSYDGQHLAESSNYSATGVDFAKLVGTFEVPDFNAKRSRFNGTSAAAAETSRLLERALLNYGDKLELTPHLLKSLSRQVAAKNLVPGLAGKLVVDGILFDNALMDALEKASQFTEK
jgi:hypothetical protein